MRHASPKKDVFLKLSYVSNTNNVDHEYGCE